MHLFNETKNNNKETDERIIFLYTNEVSWIAIYCCAKTIYLQSCMVCIMYHIWRKLHVVNSN